MSTKNSQPVTRVSELDGGTRFNAALVAAMGVALATLLTSLVVMNERDLTGVISPLTTLTDTFDFYSLPVLLLLILVTLVGWLGWLRNWWIAAIAGFVLALIAGTVGYVVRLATGGAEFTGETWSAIFTEFFGLNFVFLVSGTVFTALIGPTLFRRQVAEMLREVSSRVAHAGELRRFAESNSKLALVRIPAANPQDAQVTFQERASVDRDRANEQWESYVALLDEHGWETREVPAAETMPDSVFTEDQVIVLGQVAILARSGASSRRAELPGVRAALAETEFVTMEIEAPATLDGGDVLLAGDTVYVGASTRTNAEGIRALREIALDLGYRVVAVPITGALHLKTVATALPDGTVLAWTPALEQPSLFGGYIEAPEQLGASILPLDADTVLVSAAAPATAKLVKRLGYNVVTLDISEFEKLEGGVTCLSARAY